LRNPPIARMDLATEVAVDNFLELTPLQGPSLQSVILTTLHVTCVVIIFRVRAGVETEFQWVANRVWRDGLI